MGIWVAFTRGPFAINDAGQVAGTSAGAGGASRAFITGADGVGMRDLGALSESNFGSAYGINDSGEGMTDLNSLIDLPDGVVLTLAMGINNNGQMIAIGLIPEPETFALMLAGLGLIGFMARRKKAKNPG
jgi:probable HAF family extracellular repeat protein